MNLVIYSGDWQHSSGVGISKKIYRFSKKKYIQFPESEVVGATEWQIAESFKKKLLSQTGDVELITNSSVVFNELRVLIAEQVVMYDNIVVYFFKDGVEHELKMYNNGDLSDLPQGLFDHEFHALSRILKTKKKNS